MPHRLMTALAALLLLGLLGGARAEPHHKRGGGAARPLLTVHYIPFDGTMFNEQPITSVNPANIRTVRPVFVTSAAVAADVSRRLDPRPGTARFVPDRTRLLVVFADGRPDVMVDAFGAVRRGRARYRLPKVDMNRLDALFSRMLDDRDAAESRASEQATEDAKPALTNAVEKNAPREIQRLLEAKADPNARDLKDGTTPLMHAAEVEGSSLCEALVDGGADVNLRDNGGRTALDHAIIFGRLENFRWLLSRGAVVKGERGEGALDEALSDMILQADDKALDEIVETLIERGVSPNSRNAVGVTALMWAACGGHDTAVRLLLAHGARINAKQSNGETALTMATADGHLSTVRLLLSHGAICDSVTLKVAALGDRSILSLLQAHARRKRPVRH